MPDTIEISTKLIALITAIIALLTAIIAFRWRTNGSPQIVQKDKTKSIDAGIWEMFRFFAGFVALGFLFMVTLVGFKWFIKLFESIK